MLKRLFAKISAKLPKVSRERSLIFLAAFLVVVSVLTPRVAWAYDLSDLGRDLGLFIINITIIPLTKLALSLIVFVLTFVMEVAAYNGYLASTAVNVGWVMVRDITNLVFVVIMLIIAIGTIVGSEDYGWKHLLFQMVAMAILVNFSRTICGLAIDAAQVVMITFLNGIAATATSNVISAFGLNDILSIAPDVAATDVNLSTAFVGATAGLFISWTILFALSMFLGMLVIRMVYLWILIVLSPVAFAFNVLHVEQLHHLAVDWRKQFINNVITGPILIFFLWLTLVTVGNGKIAADIAKNSAIPNDQKITSLSGESSGIGKVLKWNSMANFIIAVGMLVIGLKTAGHLGGAGAQFVEHHALELGKEVAMYGSGIHTASHAVQHRAQGYLDMGKNMLKTGVGLAETLKTAQIKDWDKKADKMTGAKGVAAKVAMGILKSTPVVGQSSVEFHKRVKRWEQNAETANEVLESETSVGGTWGGKASVTLTNVEHAAKARDEAGKRKKFAENEEALQEGKSVMSGLFHRLEGEAVKSQSAVENLERKVKARTQEEIAAGKASMLISDADKDALFVMNGSRPVDLKTARGIDEASAALEASNVGASEKDALKAKLENAKRGLEASGLETTTQQLQTLVGTAQKLQTAEAKEQMSNEVGGQYQKRAEQISGLSAELKQIEEKESTKEQLKLLAAIKNLLGNQVFADRGGQINSLKAEQAQVELEANNGKNMALAQAKDDLLRRQRRSGEATNVQQELNRQAKVRQEAQAVGDSVSAAERFKQQRNEINRLKNDPNVDPKSLARAEQTLVDMYVANAAKHPVFASIARSLLIPKQNRAPRTMDISNIDELRKFQADELSAELNGEDVDPSIDGIRAADARIRQRYVTLYGADQADVRMQADRENWRVAQEEGAGKGALRWAGLQEIVADPDHPGMVKTQWTGLDVLDLAQGQPGYNENEQRRKESLNHVRERRINARAAAVMRSLGAGFDDSVDVITVDGENRAVVGSQPSIDFVVKIISPLQQTHLEMIPEYAKQTLASILQYSEPGARNQLLDALIAKMTGGRKQALAAIVEEAISRFSNEQANMQQTINEIRNKLNAQRP